MSENYRDESRLDSMTTEELEDILRQDAENREADSTDVAMLMQIAEVIRKRKGPDPDRKTAEEAFEIFKTQYMPPDNETEELPAHSGDPDFPREEKHKVIPGSRWVRRLVSAAAVVAVVIIFSATANGRGFQLKDFVVQWTQETFHFGAGDNQATMGSTEDNQLEFQTLQEALDAYGITTPLVPKWVPEGYEPERVKVMASPVQDIFVGIYQSGDQMLKIQVLRFVETDPLQIEHNGQIYEEYESGGIVYYLMKGDSGYIAAWLTEGYECHISGEVTVDEIKQMIDSITAEDG